MTERRSRGVLRTIPSDEVAVAPAICGWHPPHPFTNLFLSRQVAMGTDQCLSWTGGC